MGMLRVERVGKRFGARWIFRGVDFQLDQGDCLVVTGPNGSGKSTLLKILAGLIEHTEGRLVWQGGVTPARLGYAALDLALYSALTAAEHLQLAAQTRCLSLEPMGCLEKVGLAHPQNQLVSQFSTGMKMRLKLALAVQASPAILLLDEPSAALDSTGQVVLDQILKEQLERGLAIVATNSNQEANYATHTLDLAN